MAGPISDHIFLNMNSLVKVLTLGDSLTAGWLQPSYLFRGAGVREDVGVGSQPAWHDVCPSRSWSQAV